MKIKDIANDLHLSISTVSKALNGGFDISKETKEQVLNYAKSHGYKSREERLRTSYGRKLCVLYDENNVNNQANIVIPLALAFSRYARAANFDVIHIPTNLIDGDYDKFMSEHKYDGALIAGINYKSTLYTKLKNTKVPTVLLDNVIENDNISSITSESINAISELVTMLVGLGHKKIGFIHADKSSFVTNKRFSGYIIGLTNNDIEYNPNYIYYGSYSEESGKEAAKYFINTDVTAIVCPSDTIAIGLMQELQNMGKKIPEDISITGYDDLEIARYVKPSLTTVRQNIEAMAEKSFSLISSMLMNRFPQSITINSEIIKRDSIAKAKEGAVKK